MHYFNLHLGDYDGATAHLSKFEDLAYLRLLRCYYRNERPLPADLKQVYRLVRAADNNEEVQEAFQEAVVTVLNEFFTQCPEGWRHKRCDEEIAKLTRHKTVSQQGGRASGQVRRGRTVEPNPNRNATDGSRSVEPKRNRDSADGSRSVEPSNIQKPETKNQEPETKSQESELSSVPSVRMGSEPQLTRGKPRSRDAPEPWMTEFRDAYPERSGDQRWSEAFASGQARIREGYTPEAMIDGARRYRIYAEATGSVRTQYVKSAKVFLGPEKHFLAPWLPPPTKAEQRRDSNIEAAHEFLRRTDNETQ